MSDIISETQQEPQYRPRGLPWQKGQSGNPAGRRKGSRNKATLMAAPYLDGDVQDRSGYANAPCPAE